MGKTTWSEKLLRLSPMGLDKAKFASRVIAKPPGSQDDTTDIQSPVPVAEQSPDAKLFM